MGWAGGSDLMTTIILSAKDNFPDVDDRQEFYIPIIEAFQAEDCDTLKECMGSDPAWDEAFREIAPEEFDDDDDDDEEKEIDE